MTKIYPTSPESLRPKPLKLFVSYFTAMLLSTILLAGISPAKLFAAAPAITSFSPASGPVGTLVTINGTNLSTPTAFTIGGKSAIVVSNTGSVLVGMVMPGAATGAVAITTAGGTAGGSGNFTVTATPFPSGQQGAKLVGTGAVGTAGQGLSVAVSADGNTAIVGGDGDNSGIGAAWVYTRNGGAWTQQGTKLVGTGSSGSPEQGWSVSLSADGNTAIVGGYNYIDAGAGSAWVFTRSGGSWAQQGEKLVGTGGIGDTFFGYSVSLSADGNTAIVGGPGDNSGVGAAWIYSRIDSTWTQQGAKLVGTGNTGASDQGYSAALSADGNTAIVGGYADNTVQAGSGVSQGAAWVFTRSGGAWSQQGNKLVGTDSDADSQQGSSVALSADGNTAIVGGPYDSGNAGAAWVYTRSAGAWGQQGPKLVGTGIFDTNSAFGGEALQGFSVSLSADGNTAIVGGIADNSNMGAAWIYTRSSSTWTQQGYKLVGTGNVGTTVSQGGSVGISADGKTAIVGGPGDNSSAGAAWVYTEQPPPTIAFFSPADGPPGTLVTINGTNLNDPTALTIGGQSAIIISNTGSVALAMVMPGAVTGVVSVTTGGGTASSSTNFTATATKYPSVQQGTKLVGTGNTGAAQQGYSVAVSADGNTAIVGGTGDNSGVGAAWVYVRSGTTWTQQGAKLVGTGNVGGSRQGNAVAISADGNTAIVGGYADDALSGAAWVYTRSGGAWSQQGQKLPVAGTAEAPEYGYSVAISADGNTAIVGGPGDYSGGGSVWILTRSGSVWARQGQRLMGTGATGFAAQGTAVALSANGNTAIVGGTLDNSGTGAVWVYTRNKDTWTQQGSKLVGTGYVGTSQQGNSLSLSADGNTAIVGGSADNSGAGAVWIFTRSGSAWVQQGAKLAGTGSTGAAAQGWSVALSADGNTAVVGGNADNSGVGATWVYTRIGNTWSQQGNKLVGTGNTGAAGEGTSVALSATGNTAFVGGPQDNNAVGAAWVFIANQSTNALLSTIKLTPASTLTNTGTSGTTTTYTTTANAGTTSVTVTPIVQDANATIKVNGVTVISGAASGPIALAIGQTTINTVVTSPDGTTTHTYSIIVTRPVPSTNAALSTIKLTPATSLTNTGTSGTTTTYTTTVAKTTASVTVTPTAQDATATIKVNGVTVASGTASGPIAVAVGQTIINTVVTAQDGTTTKTYSIVITRPAPSANATLSTIKLTPVLALTNTGTTGTTTTYTTTATPATTSVTLTPTAADATATIKVNGIAITSGAASGPIAIAVGQTTITTVVTAQDGTTTHTYTITVTRAAPSKNALLSTIKLTPASALTNTGTSGTTTTYTTSVSNATTSVTVTPTAQDANAKIKVNGVAVTSGTASGSIALAVGQTTINTVVTAQDGTTTRTYSITVTRATGPLHSLYTPISVIQPADELNIENDGVLVHQGVSPNGDGINDFLTIDGIIAYPNNNLQIIDRNGALIYQAKGYNNIAKVFDGHSAINGRMLQPGTYFYSLDYVADGQTKHKTGFIILKY